MNWRKRVSVLLLLIVVFVGLRSLRPHAVRQVLRSSSAHEPLDHRIQSRKGLIVAHYPFSFHAAISDYEGIELNREYGDVSETVLLTAVDKPVDLDSFARTCRQRIAGLPHFQEIDSRRVTCNGVDGIEFSGTWFVSEKRPMFRHSCAFVRGGVGFLLSFSVSQQFAAAARPGLQRILDATEFPRG